MSSISTEQVSPSSDINPLDPPPWMDSAAFPVPPSPLTYGYHRDRTSHVCSEAELIEQVQRDAKKEISLVWTPSTPHLLPPEEVPWLFDAVRTREHAHLKRALVNALMHVLCWGFLVAASAMVGDGLAHFPLYMLVALGIIPLLDHSWGLYRIRSYTPESIARHIPGARYTVWLGRCRAVWTRALVLCMACVGAVQLVLDMWFLLDRSSVAAAGIVKPAVRAGEWWRLLTGALLHANILHLAFNLAALFALGKILEVTFHRAYVPIVFVLSALSGSLWSLILLPHTTSVGASGGIMGLLGFVLVLAWTQRGYFPHAIRRSLLISVVYIIVSGLMAYRIIDNPAHVGGLTVGVILGAVHVRFHQVRIPDTVSPCVTFVSFIMSGVILVTTLWCLFLMLGL